MLVLLCDKTFLTGMLHVYKAELAADCSAIRKLFSTADGFRGLTVASRVMLNTPYNKLFPPSRNSGEGLSSDTQRVAQYWKQ